MEKSKIPGLSPDIKLAICNWQKKAIILLLFTPNLKPVQYVTSHKQTAGEIDTATLSICSFTIRSLILLPLIGRWDLFSSHRRTHAPEIKLIITHYSGSSITTNVLGTVSFLKQMHSFSQPASSSDATHDHGTTKTLHNACQLFFRLHLTNATEQLTAFCNNTPNQLLG